MIPKQYTLADLTEEELQKLKETEGSLNNLAGASPEQAEKQKLVLIAYRHAKK
ncbi:MAG: hypothetical protein GX989_06585 [Firmicutes bacterium]|nr:hypothetical protein [Bacillota bacterium]